MSSPIPTSLAYPVLVLTALYLLRARPLPSIPVHPGSLPIVGHGLSLVRHFLAHGEFAGWYRKVIDAAGKGTVGQVMITSWYPVVVLSTPKQIEDVYSSAHFDGAENTRRLMGAVIPGSMIAHKTDDVHKAHRRAFAYSHSNAFLALSGRYLSAHIDVLFGQWSDAASTGTFFSASEDLRRMMSDVIAQVSFGESFGQLKTKTAHPMALAMTFVFSSLVKVGFVAPLHWTQRALPSYKKSQRVINEYVAERVEHAREKIRDGGEIAEIECLIDIVMRKEARDGEGSVMAEDELADEMHLAMAAGHETSVSAQLWALKYLSEHLDVQHKLHQSLVSLLPSSAERAPTNGEVGPAATPYLEAVVHEILRFAPIAPTSTRQAVRDTTVSDSTGATLPVPKGAIVSMQRHYAATHLHLDPASGIDTGKDDGDGLRFRPERWLDPQTGAFDSSLVWSRPFGGGPKMCYGYRLALVFLRLFLAQLSLAYFILPIPDELRAEGVQKRSLAGRPASDWVGLRRWEDVVEEVGEKGSGEKKEEVA